MTTRTTTDRIHQRNEGIWKTWLHQALITKDFGKNAVIFYAYSGPHNRIGKEIPAMKFMRHFLEHSRFDVKMGWYIVGES